MPFLPEEMDDIQEAVKEAYEYVQFPFKLVRYDPAKQDIDPLYKEVLSKVADKYDCAGTVAIKPDKKVLERFGVTQDVDLLVYVAQKLLIETGLTVMETDRLELRNEVYRVVKTVREAELPVQAEVTEDNPSPELRADFLALAIFAKKDG